MTTLLLYGGGIDSTTLLAYLASQGEVVAVYFEYGQKAQALELETGVYFTNKYHVPLHVIRVPLAEITNSALTSGVLANDPKVNIVDGRNLVFVSLAAMLAAKLGAERLALGFHQEPESRPFPDATPEFVVNANLALAAGLKHNVQIEIPFADKTRHQIFQLAQELDVEILKKAHTCYENVRGGCGQCTHCLLKAQILSEMQCAE